MGILRVDYLANGDVHGQVQPAIPTWDLTVPGSLGEHMLNFACAPMYSWKFEDGYVRLGGEDPVKGADLLYAFDHPARAATKKTSKKALPKSSH